MNECEAIQELLAWPSQSRGEGERARVQAHLETCAECAALARRYAAQEQFLRRTRPADLVLPQWGELEARMRGEERGWRVQSERGSSVFARGRRAWTLAAILLGILLAVALAWPGAVTVAAQQVERIVQRLRLGRYTDMARVSTPAPAAADQPSSLPATPVVKQQGDLWIVQTPIGNFGGNMLPGRSRTVQRFRTWKEAQAAAPFVLRRPAYLPARYSFREAMVTPLDWVLLFYDGGLVVAQVPVGPRPSDGTGHLAIGVGMLTEQPIEEVTLDGQPAGWVRNFGLMWEEDGISYTVGAPGLDLDEAMRIAGSLE
jgi:hypothetical protein